MRKLLLFAIALLLMPCMALAQSQMEWESAGVFPPDTLGIGNGHGLAVDGSGKVWMASYYASEEVVEGEDTTDVRAIYVYEEDGTPAAFSPITLLTVGSETDTLLAASTGLAADHNGNILYTNTAGMMYRINASTGEAMDKVVVYEADNTSLTAPSVSSNGNIAVASTFPGIIRVFDEEFTLLQTVTEETGGFSRTILFMPDGNTIYHPTYSLHAVTRYTRADEFSEFGAVPDTVLKGFDSESIAINPATGYLWASAGSPNDLPNQFLGAETSYRSNVWYAFDPADLDGSGTAVPVDSMAWPGCESWDVVLVCEQSQGRPRGLAFNAEGDVAYVTQFSESSPAFYKLIQSEVNSVERGDLPEGFALKQNFPNPFRGETEITFSLHQAGHVSLRVFDVLGREVATLVDKTMTAGTEHSVRFTGRDLPAGIYLYSLQTEGYQVERKMVLVK